MKERRWHVMVMRAATSRHAGVGSGIVVWFDAAGAGCGDVSELSAPGVVVVRIDGAVVVAIRAAAGR